MNWFVNLIHQTRTIMKTIIGYTDSITECECCGKTDLKGTYCLDIDGVEVYYGSVCALKKHGVSIEDQKIAKKTFSKIVKNKTLIAKYITPLKNELAAHLERMGSTDLTSRFPGSAANYIYEYNRVIELRCKKYNITL